MSPAPVSCRKENVVAAEIKEETAPPIITELKEIQKEIKIMSAEKDKGNQQTQEMGKKIEELSNKLFVYTQNNKPKVETDNPPLITVSAPTPQNELAELARKNKELERRLVAIEKQTRKYVDEKTDAVLNMAKKEDGSIKEQGIALEEKMLAKYKELESGQKAIKDLCEEQKSELKALVEQNVKTISRQIAKQHDEAKGELESLGKKIDLLRSEKDELEKSIEELRGIEKNIDTKAREISENVVKKYVEEGEQHEKKIATKFAEVESNQKSAASYVNELAGVLKKIEEGKGIEGDLLRELMNKMKIAEAQYVSFESEVKEKINKIEEDIYQGWKLDPPCDSAQRFSDKIGHSNDQKCLNASFYSWAKEVKERINHIDNRFSSYRTTIGNEITCYAKQLHALRNNVSFLLGKAENGSKPFSSPIEDQSNRCATKTASELFSSIAKRLHPEVLVSTRKVSVDTAGLLPETTVESVRSPWRSENISILFPSDKAAEKSGVKKKGAERGKH